MKIALFAALPEEYRPFKRSTGPWRVKSRKPFPSFLRSSSGKEILIVQTGMGQESISKALSWAVSTNSPDLVISFGFTGSLHRDFTVGQVLLGDCFARIDPRSGLLLARKYHCKPSDHLIRFCAAHGVGTAQVITADQPQPKLALSISLRDPPSVLDMESYHVASYAFQRRIPFLSFRAVSDALEDEIDYDLNAIADSRGRVRIHKVLAAVSKEPRLTVSFFASWRRSSKAARRLSEVITAFLDLPLVKENQPLAEISVLGEVEGRGGLNRGTWNSAK